MLSQDMRFALGELLKGAEMETYEGALIWRAPGDVEFHFVPDERRAELLALVAVISPEGQPPRYGVHPKITAALEDAVFDIACQRNAEGV